MKKSVKIVLAAAIALPVVVAAAIPFFVNANTFRPKIESRLSTALSRKVTLGNLSLSLTKGRLEADDLTIAEDPKFGQTPFFTAKLLHIGVQMKPLIFHHELLIRSFEVDAPQIHLIRAEDGTWNFSTLSHGTDRLDTTRPTSLPDLPVDRIIIKDGNATIETLPSQKNPQVYDHLNVTVEHFSLAQPFPFRVSASLPGDGKVDVSGTVGPINPQDAASTAFDTQVKIQHLDPVTAGYVDPAAGVSTIAGLDAHFVSDGTNVTSNGKVHAEHLIILKGGKAAPLPLDLSYQIVHSLKSNSGQVSDLVFQTGAIAIHIKGNYQLTANVPVLDLKLLAQSVPLNDLQALMPAVGVKLPNNATLKGGTLSADFTIKGSPTDNVIVGSYEIKNTTLVGYDIGSKIAGIAALGGIKTGDTAVIDVSRANVRITKSGSESTKIYSVLPALGVSTGSGTVSPSGQLNFHLISKVTNAKGLNKVGINLLTKMNSTSDAAKPSNASGIPITITGTAEEPVITADVNGLMKGNAATIKKKLSKLFGKKE
ncbi:AsmA family protein [Tunturibacter psychrotolerans]|uniref:AsmA family protein n=1 Tax=Tunturiibacter psychrotolerans TaxID=3069686 RepID=A0AAU7ZL40_9BACT